MTTLTRREAILGMAAATLATPFKALAQSPLFPKGAIIRTLFKDYSPEALAGGATLFHEHLSLGSDFGARFGAATAATLAAQGVPASARPPGPPPPPPGPDPMRDVELMAEELRSAQRDGVGCIVDAGLQGTGMDLNFIREAAKRSGLPVVKGAGFYTEPFYPKEIATMSEEQIAHELIRQADEYPAGVFGEIGSWDEITAIERKVFRAVGRAHLATNLPIFTHTGIPGKSALEQLDILEDAGVDPQRVVIGHLGNLRDPQVYVHKAICRRGAYVGFDRQSQGSFSDDPVVPQVMALIEAGFAEHLLFSGDGFRSYAKPLTAFLPKLKAAGVSDETLHRITVDNPRRFLAFVSKRPRTPVRAYAPGGVYQRPLSADLRGGRKDRPCMIPGAKHTKTRPTSFA
jgi:phosphotriesterase-related protein